MYLVEGVPLHGLLLSSWDRVAGRPGAADARWSVCACVPARARVRLHARTRKASVERSTAGADRFLEREVAARGGRGRCHDIDVEVRAALPRPGQVLLAPGLPGYGLLTGPAAEQANGSAPTFIQSVVIVSRKTICA
jgi:hypothetical protein